MASPTLYLPYIGGRGGRKGSDNSSISGLGANNISGSLRYHSSRLKSIAVKQVNILLECLIATVAFQ